MSVARAVEAVFDLVEGLVDTVVENYMTNDFGEASSSLLLVLFSSK